ncbi:S-layer homology domain-containing protein [uncultured Dialister sp.]|uniref:S-layer homology domain-containing protein n=1 Tax=uncultured Dialister sp. TaxID=278064 RepID=UPI00265FA2A7|nr:S-layer homology domain-containing protein [uncultured Dialister sp.]
MKKILALAAAAALTAGVSAYAANPFSDVSTDDWAYQAVSDLSDQGVVEGYPDGTFKGERNITRYELAQIIARLMAKEDQLNAEQRATLDKLAGEYADELANLGVRVSNLEKKVGNISWSGNARMRFNQSYDEKGDATDKWDGRMKIIAKGQVNDSTVVTGRLRYDMNFKDADDPNHVYMEELKVNHQFGDNLSVTLGRQDVFLGQTGIQFDDEFDGAVATAKLGGVNVDLGYGRFYCDGASNGKWSTSDWLKNDTETFLGRIYGDAGRISYDVEYLDGKDSLDARLIGAGLTAGLGGDFKVFGDYYKNTEYKGDPYTWTAGLGYGATDWKKPGTWDLSAQYIHAERGAYLNDTTYNVAPASIVGISGTKDDDEADVAKYWLINGDVILQQNVKLHAEYAFDVKADNHKDYDDLWSVSLNYVF